MSESNPIKRTRLLTNALIISATLNISFLATLIYTSFKDKPSHIAASLTEEPAKKKQIHSAQFEAIAKLTYHELLFILSDKSAGKKRELALSALAHFHHFDVKRALGSMLPSHADVLFHETSIPLLTAIEEHQYLVLIRFAKTEMWPFTAQGLFLKLKESKPPRDRTLLETLFITDEFNTIHTLFQRTRLLIKKEILLELLLEADWDTLKQFSNHLNDTHNFTESARREFLLTYSEKRSKIAARILIETDREFAIEKFGEEKIAHLQKQLPKKKETPPPEKKPSPPKKVVHPPGLHIVQKGESLSQIATQYKIPIEDLRMFNYLNSDELRVGQELVIPEH